MGKVRPKIGLRSLGVDILDLRALWGRQISKKRHPQNRGRLSHDADGLKAWRIFVELFIDYFLDANLMFFLGIFIKIRKRRHQRPVQFLITITNTARKKGTEERKEETRRQCKRR